MNAGARNSEDFSAHTDQGLDQDADCVFNRGVVGSSAGRLTLGCGRVYRLARSGVSRRTGQGFPVAPVVCILAVIVFQALD